MSTIKIKYGECKECTQEKAIYSKGLCQYCYWRNKASKSQYKPKPQPIKKRSSKGSKIASEDSKFFKEIWEERPHKSEISGKPLRTYSPTYMSHILTKGAYPKARHWKENIMLMTFLEHQEWEFADRSTAHFKAKFSKALKRYNDLLVIYYAK